MKNAVRLLKGNYEEVKRAETIRYHRLIQRRFEFAQFIYGRHCLKWLFEISDAEYWIHINQEYLL